MKKKYQVFISSTYNDLQEERAAVTQCLLEMNCIPVGMEQFPASNLSQMEYIKMMLDDCDYYILILAGKYGSCDERGIGFTENEYDYALAQGIPVMSFVIQDTGRLLSEKCEMSPRNVKKLQAFREKVCTGKLVKFYSDVGSLKAAVATSLSNCIRTFPAVGWIRGEEVGRSDDIERRIEEYMREHTISTSDIDRMFGDRPLISDGGDANSAERKNAVSQSEEVVPDTISMEGARTIIENFKRSIPKIKI